MTIPLKYEDVVANLDAALAREAALREELDLLKPTFESTFDAAQRDRTERDALQQRLTVAEQDSLELRSALVGSLAREDELSARLSDLDDEWSKSITERGFLSLERDRLKAFAEQIARQQGEPYFAKLAKVALKPAAEVVISKPPMPMAEVFAFNDDHDSRPDRED